MRRLPVEGRLNIVDVRVLHAHSIIVLPVIYTQTLSSGTGFGESTSTAWALLHMLANAFFLLLESFHGILARDVRWVGVARRIEALIFVLKLALLLRFFVIFLACFAFSDTVRRLLRAVPFIFFLGDFTLFFILIVIVGHAQI